MKPYFETMRPGNCLMASLAVTAGFILVSRSVSAFLIPEMYIAVISAFLITAAGNAINDYTDVSSDKINRPSKPIPSGRLSRNSTLIFSVILFLMGIALSFFLPRLAFYIAVFNSMILILYSFYLQGKVFISNISVSYLVASTFLFGGAAAGNISLASWLALLAFLPNTAREIVKDIEDMEGDRMSISAVKKMVMEGLKKIAFGSKGKSIAARYSEKASKIAAMASLLIGILISPIPFLSGLLGMGYLPFLLLADISFAYSAYRISKARKKKDYSAISRNIKMGMLLGLLAFMAGIFL